MSADKEAEQQQSPNAEEDHPGTHSPVKGGSKPPTCKSTSFSFKGSAATAKERKQDSYRRVRELEKEIKRIKLEDNLDSDDSLSPKMNLGENKNICTKNHRINQKNSPIKITIVGKIG